MASRHGTRRPGARDVDEHDGHGPDEHAHDEHAHDEHRHDEPGHAHGGHGGHGHGHGHGVSRSSDRRWLSVALSLIVVLMVGEVVAGAVAGSLALLSDAAHMLTDAISIVLALVAMRLAARPARGAFTYGYKRWEILSAQANGLTLLAFAVWLTGEAVHRLIDPPAVGGGLVVVTALVGVAVNVAATWAISRANRASLNVEGAFQHLLTDLYGFIATAVAGAVVLLTGFTRADALASLVVVVLMVRAGVALVRDSGRVILEAAPAGVDPDELGCELVALAGVDEVHDLHVWEITSGEVALSAHVLVEPGSDCHAHRRAVQNRLARDHGITHTTLQVDHSPSADDHARYGAMVHRVDPCCAEQHGPVHVVGPHRH